MRRIWISMMVTLAAAGCGTDHVPIHAAGVAVRVAPATAVILAGDSIDLRASFLAGAPSNERLAWSSRDEAVVHVDPAGRVRGLRGGTSFVVASLGALRDSSRITVVAAPDDASEVRTRVTSPSDTTHSGLSYPNEPPDHALIAASSMDRRFPWGPDRVRGSAGSWWQYPADDPATAIRVGEAFPGEPFFNRTTFDPGHAPGRAPVNWGAWNGDGSQRGEEQERIYFSMRIRLATDGRVPVWESQRIGTKLGFFAVGRCDGAHNELYPFLQGGTRSVFTLRMGQQGVQSEMWGQNRMRGPVMRVGQWHHWELEMALNDIGRANGVLRWWVDGRLIMEHRNVVYRTAEDPCGFLAWKWNPTWGGTGGPPRTRRDYVDISDVRISGRPLASEEG